LLRRPLQMNPLDPESAQRIVFEYAELVERDVESGRRPAAVASLPYPKETIKLAVRTCVTELATCGQLTEEMREFLREVYVALADYLEEDLLRLLSDYRDAAAALERDSRRPSEKLTSPAWEVVAESGRLAGGIARAVAEDAQGLRSEFEAIVGGAPMRSAS
jgi:hypothetical protein